MTSSRMSLQDSTGFLRRALEAALRWAESHLSLLLAAYVGGRMVVLLVRVIILARFQEGAGLAYFEDFQLARLSDAGAYPFLHFWMEYPPVFPWLVVGAYRLLALVGLAQPGPFYLLIGTCFVLAESLTLIGVHRLGALARGPQYARHAALLFGLASAPLYIHTGWFDTLPAALLVFGALALVAGKPAGAGALAGIGTLTKVFPVLLAPVALRALPAWPSRARFFGAMSAAMLATGLPFLLAAPDYFLAWIAVTARRPPWETIWAIWDGYLGFGVVPGLLHRFDPSAAVIASDPTHYNTLLFAIFAAIALGYALWQAPDQPAPRSTLSLLLFAMVVFLIANKGYSPQFLIWLMPIVCVGMATRTALVFALALGVINLLEYPFYFHFFYPSGQRTGLLVAIILARTAILLAIAAISLRDLSRSPKSSPA